VNPLQQIDLKGFPELACGAKENGIENPIKFPMLPEWIRESEVKSATV
jgi:hypothetical protein